MARPNEEIVMAWASLAGSSALAGWSSIPIVSPAGCSLLAARRSPDNEEAILAGFTGLSIPSAEKLPEGQGFAVERVDLGDGKTWLALTRKLSGGVELFLAAYFSPSWTAFQPDGGRDFSVIVDGVSV